MASQNPDNWTYNSQTGYRDIGISTKIGEIQFHNSPVSTREDFIPFGVRQEDAAIKTVSENIAKSTGRSSKRDSHKINTFGGGAGTRGGAGIMLVLNFFFVAYDLWSAISVLHDLNAIDKQKIILETACEEVSDALSEGIIPPQYINLNDLGAIINFVFQGVNETGNQNITIIGANILKNIGKYDSKTKTVRPLLQE